MLNCDCNFVSNEDVSIGRGGRNFAAWAEIEEVANERPLAGSHGESAIDETDCARMKRPEEPALTNGL